MIAAATPRGWLLTIACSVVLFGPAIVGAQDQRPNAHALRDRLAALESELQSERELATQRTATRKLDLEGLEARRRELAEGLLQVELGRREDERALDQLRSESVELERQTTELRTALAGFQQTVLEAVEQLLLFQREIPGRQLTSPLEALEDLLSAAELEQLAPLDPGDHATNLWRALDELHRLGSTVTLERTEVWTADGHREPVDLLSCGLFGFAYRTVDGGRIALALASSADATGYRWSEDLPADHRSALQRAFDQWDDGDEKFLPIPIDVTGHIAASSLTTETSWWTRIESGGRIMFPLGFIALLALLLVLERTWFLFARNGLEIATTARTLEAAAVGDLATAEKSCDGQRGAVSAVLRACLRRHSAGAPAMEDSIQEQLLHEVPRLQRFLTGLGILAAVAPLLGLLGTVTGIIETFGVIRAFGNDNPALMAGGISEALITTATGLIVAIPILLLRGLLRSRVDRILWYAEKSAATLLNTLVHDRDATPQRADR